MYNERTITVNTPSANELSQSAKKSAVLEAFKIYWNSDLSFCAGVAAWQEKFHEQKNITK